MKAAGRVIDPADLPPPLAWEGELWRRLYQRVATQWRVGGGGATGLDYGVAVLLIREFGWQLEISLDLLGVIERTVLEEIGKKSDAGQSD